MRYEVCFVLTFEYELTTKAAWLTFVKNNANAVAATCALPIHVIMWRRIDVTRAPSMSLLFPAARWKPAPPYPLPSPSIPMPASAVSFSRAGVGRTPGVALYNFNGAINMQSWLKRGEGLATVDVAGQYLMRRTRSLAGSSAGRAQTGRPTVVTRTKRASDTSMYSFRPLPSAELFSGKPSFVYRHGIVSSRAEVKSVRPPQYRVTWSWLLPLKMTRVAHCTRYVWAFVSKCLLHSAKRLLQ